MHTIILLGMCSLLIPNTPVPTASIMKGGATRCLVGITPMVTAQRRPTVATQAISAELTVPVELGSDVGWTLFDIQGRMVGSGRSHLPETGSRQILWAFDDVGRSGVFLVKCTGRGGSYVLGTIFISPY